MLEAVADVAEQHEVADALPQDERALWQRLGARFAGPQAVAPSHARMADAWARLVEDSVAGDQAMAAELGVSRSRVSQRVSERSLYAYVGPSGERFFPRWQLWGPRPLHGLPHLLAALDVGLHPLTVHHWFTTPNGRAQTAFPASPDASRDLDDPRLAGAVADAAERLGTYIL